MKYKKFNKKQQEQIAYEYLTGDKKYQELVDTYGVSERTIQRWVKSLKNDVNTLTGKRPGRIVQDVALDIEQMKEDLDKVRLHNLLLEELLKIGKEQYGIDLRKKTGAKQS